MLSMSASPVDQMSGLFTKKTYPVASSCPVGPTHMQVLARRGLKKDWRSPPRHERARATSSGNVARYFLGSLSKSSPRPQKYTTPKVSALMLVSIPIPIVTTGNHRTTPRTNGASQVVGRRGGGPGPVEWQCCAAFMGRITDQLAQANFVTS